MVWTLQDDLTNLRTAEWEVWQQNVLSEGQGSLFSSCRKILLSKQSCFYQSIDTHQYTFCQDLTLFQNILLLMK